MNSIFALTEKIAYPFLRIAMGVVVFWIGALKFIDPSPVVGLIKASFPFLAFNGFVYFLGAIEVVVALVLFANFRVRYVGLVLMALFAGTLTIFLIAPKVSYGDAGFPLLSLAGQFLLKDLVLFGASLSLVAMAPAGEAVRERLGMARAPMA